MNRTGGEENNWIIRLSGRHLCCSQGLDSYGRAVSTTREPLTTVRSRSLSWKCATTGARYYTGSDASICHLDKTTIDGLRRGSQTSLAKQRARDTQRQRSNRDKGLPDLDAHGRGENWMELSALFRESNKRILTAEQGERESVWKRTNHPTSFPLPLY